MNYTIKTYQEGFIEDQFKIGSAIYDPWPMGGQTRPEQLRQAYQGEDFDPETRFYAFDGDEMIGFLTSAFKEEREGKKVYFFEPPYVKEQHAPAAEVQLMDHAIKALKAKGADILLTRAGPYWGKSQHYAEKYGFERTGDIVRGAWIDITDKQPSDFGDPSRFIDFHYDTHFDSLVDLYVDKLGAPRGNIQNSLTRWKNMKPGKTTTSPWDHILTVLGNKIALEGEKVVGRLMAMNHSNFGDDTISLSTLMLADGKEDLLGDVLAILVKLGQQHNKSKMVIHSGLWGALPTDDPYNKYGLELDMKLAFYEKELA